MSDRKDLPPPTAANFLGRMREEMMRMMGKQGDKLDQALTVRDMIAAGFARLRPGGLIEPAPGIGGREPDFTPPPPPTGFATTGAISHVLIEHDAPAYPQGGGHGRTRVYGVIYTGGALPTFNDAVELGQFSGTVWAMPSNPATTWRLWIKWETIDGVVSPVPAGGTNGLAATTGQDVSKLLAALQGEITESQLFQSLGNRIDLIDGAGIGSVNQRIAAEAVQRGLEIDELASSTGQNLLNEVAARQSGDQALQTQINTLAAASSGDFQELLSALQEEQTARVNGDTAEAMARQTLATQMRGSYSGTDVTQVTQGLMFSERQARSAADSAIAQDVSALSATVQTNKTNADAALQSEATTRASADSALSSQVTALNASLTTTNTNVATAQSTANNAATAAASAQTAANTANTTLADIASDSKLTPNEKADVRREWNVAAAEKAGLNTQASNFGITSENTAYNAAFQALANYLNNGTTWSTGVPSWISDANLSTTTNIVGSTFRTNWQNFYSARTTLLNRIALKAKELADAAQSTANTKADASALNSLSATVTNQGNTLTAQGEAITGLQSSVGNNTAALQAEATTRATQTGELFAKYTVKVDVNGYVSGFGLASTANNATPTSEFAVRADNFYVASPSGPGVSPSMPFIVRTTSTTIGGVSVPAGVYLVDAFIQNGTINNAKIANLAVDNAKIASMSVDKLTAGSLAVGQHIQSTSYAAGSAGWRINADGTAELNNVTVRGTVYATNGQFSGTILGGSATGYGNGLGFFSGVTTGYRWRVGDPAGARIQWTGTAIEVYNSSNQLTFASGGITAAQVSGLGSLATQNSVSYSAVTGTKPPADADKTSANTAAGIVNQGAFATLSQINSSNISTYIANAAIGSAQIGSIALVGTSNFSVKSGTAGARMEMDSRSIKVFDANGVLRVQIGDLTA